MTGFQGADTEQLREHAELMRDRANSLDGLRTRLSMLVAHGADVILVDTLAPSIGDVSVLRGTPMRIDGQFSDRFWPEAWAMRRMLRERTVRPW